MIGFGESQEGRVADDTLLRGGWRAAALRLLQGEGKNRMSDRRSRRAAFRLLHGEGKDPMSDRRPERARELPEMPAEKEGQGKGSVEEVLGLLGAYRELVERGGGTGEERSGFRERKAGLLRRIDPGEREEGESC
jgi:hypothetical protein